MTEGDFGACEAWVSRRHSLTKAELPSLRRAFDVVHLWPTKKQYDKYLDGRGKVSDLVWRWFQEGCRNA